MRRCVVAGGSGGIGLAICRELLRSGHDVVSCSRRRVEIPAELEAHWVHHRLDVTSNDEVAQFAAQVLDASPRIDALINCVGIPVFGPVTTVSEEQFAASLNVNLLSHYRLVRRFIAPMLVQRAGVIISVESIAASRPLAFASAYCAAKAGMAAFSESLRLEVRELGVRVVQLQPGLVDTPFTDDLGIEAQNRQVAIPAAAIARLVCQAVVDETMEWSQVTLRPSHKNAIADFVQSLKHSYKDCYEKYI